MVNNSLYHKYISRTATGEEVVGFIKRQPKGNDFFSDNRYTRIGPSIKVFLQVGNINYKEFRKIFTNLESQLSVIEPGLDNPSDGNTESTELLKEQRNNLTEELQILKHIENYDLYNQAEILSKKIALTEQFSIER